MAVQVSLVVPSLLEQEDVVFCSVPVDVATETAGLDCAPLSDRFEDSQHFIMLLSRYPHPYSCENHLAVPPHLLIQDLSVSLCTDNFLFPVPPLIIGPFAIGQAA